MRIVEIGKFEVTGGRLACSDPCYSNPYDLGCVIRARAGTWVATASIKDGGDRWGDRVWELNARHVDATIDNQSRFDLVRAESPVDGGVFGVFDADRYSQGDRNAELRAIMFPGGLAASSAPDYALVTAGAVTGSGYGDGGYNVYAVLDDLVPHAQRVMAVKVVFINDTIYREHLEEIDQ